MPNVSSSNELVAKVLQRPSFRLMLPLGKQTGVTVSTQTIEAQEPMAKPKPIKLGDEP